MSFRKPNLFILGAPKCGTTSLVHWLRQHSEIYMSPSKEPHFFDTDHNPISRAALNNENDRSLDVYESLFKKVRSEHDIVGEASVLYLSSKCAVKNIKEYNNDAKFVVMLRNPVDMVYSWHTQKVIEQSENINVFEKAWSEQSNRRMGINVSKVCVEPQMLQYGQICSLGTQLQRVLDNIDSNNLHVIFLEDIKKDTKGEFQNLMRFLNINTDEDINFEIKNRSSRNRINWLKKITKHISYTARKFNLPSLNTGLIAKIDKSNKEPFDRPELSSKFRNNLKKYFKEEILLLSELTGRNLNHWLKEH